MFAKRKELQDSKHFVLKKINNIEPDKLKRKTSLQQTWVVWML